MNKRLDYILTEWLEHKKVIFTKLPKQYKHYENRQLTILVAALDTNEIDYYDHVIDIELFIQCAEITDDKSSHIRMNLPIEEVEMEIISIAVGANP